MSGQQKKHSLLEQIVSTAVGFVVACFVWEYIMLPLFDGAYLTKEDTVIITAIYTFFSIIRGYGFRRAFNYFTERKR